MRELALILGLLCIVSVQAQNIELKTAEDYSPYVFGFNLEHTRSAVNGGLSAQMLKNRKFAGKPQANLGLADHWFPIGEKILFLLDEGRAYTKHICLPNMHRRNEINRQVLENLKANQVTGIGQHELGLKAGKTFDLRLVTRVSNPLTRSIYV